MVIIFNIVNSLFPACSHQDAKSIYYNIDLPYNGKVWRDFIILVINFGEFGRLPNEKLANSYCTRAYSSKASDHQFKLRQYQRSAVLPILLLAKVP